jgi:DNA-binding transcriptional regulator YiaG
LSGLENVLLVGINVFECPECEAVCPEIPRIDELHRVISSVLIAKSTILSGQELCFLRRTAGISGQDFAELLGISPEHLSRVENGKHAVSNSLDKLSRVLVSQDTNVREILLGVAKELRSIRTSVFALRNNGWKVKRKAA